MFKEISLKLGNMRKAEDFTICPRPTNVGDNYKLIRLQSEHREIVFDYETGKGFLSAYAKNYPSIRNGGNTEITLDKAIIEQIQANQPKRGDVLHGFLVIG